MSTNEQCRNNFHVIVYVVFRLVQATIHIHDSYSYLTSAD